MSTMMGKDGERERVSGVRLLEVQVQNRHFGLPLHCSDWWKPQSSVENLGSRIAEGLDIERGKEFGHFFSIWQCWKNESWHTYTQWAYYKFWLWKEWGHIIYRYNKTYTTYYLYHIVNWILHNGQLTFSGTITLICKKPVAAIENWTASLWIWVDGFHQRARQTKLCIRNLLIH